MPQYKEKYKDKRLYRYTALFYITHYSVDILFINRDDGHPVCLSGHFLGRFAGEEAEPVCSRSDSNGHAGQSDLHGLLRVLPLPGL